MKHFIIMLLLISNALCVYGEDVIKTSTAEENMKKFDTKIIKKIKIPKGYHEGIMLHADNVWVNNGEGLKTWVINKKNGELIKEIVPPHNFSEGIFFHSNKYWVSDWNSSTIYICLLEDNKFISEKNIFTGPGRLAGACLVADKLHLLIWEDTVIPNYSLLIMSMTGDVIEKMRIKGIKEPSQIIYDGNNIWITSWYSRKVYKVDPENYKVIGYFDAPVKDTTGIAHDGKYFFITGTYSDLYKIEVFDDE